MDSGTKPARDGTVMAAAKTSTPGTDGDSLMPCQKQGNRQTFKLSSGPSKTDLASALLGKEQSGGRD